MSVKLNDEQVLCISGLGHGVEGPTPDAVIAEAKRRASPLHDLFDWDRDKAAMEHWRDRAREIITAVVQVHPSRTQNVTVTVTVPRYVHDPDKPQDQGYKNIEVLGKVDPEAARRMLRAEFTRAAGYLQRAQNIAVALGLEDEVERLLDELLGLQRRVSDAA